MFFYKLRRIFCMFKNLVTNDIVKFFVFKRKMLSICIYKYLMRIYFYISASMVIIIDKLFNNNISSMDGLCPEPTSTTLSLLRIFKSYLVCGIRFLIFYLFNIIISSIFHPIYNPISKCNVFR